MASSKLGQFALVASMIGSSGSLCGQSDLGELRLSVLEPAGAALSGQIDLVSEGSGVHRRLRTDSRGQLDLPRLPFGRYRLSVTRDGFDTEAAVFEIHSALPTKLQLTLHIHGPSASVQVDSDASTLIDPQATGAEVRLGREAIEQRPGSLRDGRSSTSSPNSPVGSSRATPCSIPAGRSTRPSTSSTVFR